MWALRKDQQKLSPGQRGTLAQIAATNRPLYTGYLIKEQIREAFKVKGDQGKTSCAASLPGRTAAASPSSPSWPGPLSRSPAPKVGDPSRVFTQEAATPKQPWTTL
jgi:hypothetical protein